MSTIILVIITLIWYINAHILYYKLELTWARFVDEEYIKIKREKFTTYDDIDRPLNERQASCLPPFSSLILSEQEVHSIWNEVFIEENAAGIIMFSC
jgi:hypothetical protein